MSAVIVFTPVIIASWPIISAAVVGAVGAMGYTTVSSAVEGHNELNSKVEQDNQVDIDIDNSEVVGETMKREELLVFTKEDITVSFQKDVRGKLKITVTGKGRAKSELEQIGKEIAEKVTRQYSYNRVIEELGTTNFSIVDQDVDEDETIRIHVRGYQ